MVSWLAQFDPVFTFKNFCFRGFRDIFNDMDEPGKPGAMTIEVEGKTSAKLSDERETIAVIGSGDFGRALAGRMVKAGGYNVVVGSRDVQKNWQENIGFHMFPTG